MEDEFTGFVLIGYLVFLLLLLVKLEIEDYYNRLRLGQQTHEVKIVIDTFQ
jgi:hypothetical protein